MHDPFICGNRKISQAEYFFNRKEKDYCCFGNASTQQKVRDCYLVAENRFAVELVNIANTNSSIIQETFTERLVFTATAEPMLIG